MGSATLASTAAARRRFVGAGRVRGPHYADGDDGPGDAARERADGGPRDDQEAPLIRRGGSVQPVAAGREHASARGRAQGEDRGVEARGAGGRPNGDSRSGGLAKPRLGRASEADGLLTRQ